MKIRKVISKIINLFVMIIALEVAVFTGLSILLAGMYVFYSIKYGYHDYFDAVFLLDLAWKTANLAAIGGLSVWLISPVDKFLKKIFINFFKFIGR